MLEHTFCKKLGNCEEQLTSTDCRPTDNQQVTDRSPTGYQQVAESRQKYLREKNTLLKPMSKPTKLTKSEKLTESEEQLIVNPEVWINMKKN